MDYSLVGTRFARSLFAAPALADILYLLIIRELRQRTKTGTQRLPYCAYYQV